MTLPRDNMNPGTQTLRGCLYGCDGKRNHAPTDDCEGERPRMRPLAAPAPVFVAVVPAPPPPPPMPIRPRLPVPPPEVRVAKVKPPPKKGTGSRGHKALPFVHLLGTVPDHEIAAMAGISTPSVAVFRVPLNRSDRSGLGVK